MGATEAAEAAGFVFARLGFSTGMARAAATESRVSGDGLG